MTDVGITPPDQPFENFSFNVTALAKKTNHEINLLPLFLSISHLARPYLLYNFLSYHKVSYSSRLFHAAYLALRTGHI